MSAVEADGFRVEAAMQFGAKCDDNAENWTYTEAQLIAFAKACERAGRAQIATALRKVAEKQPAQSVRDTLATVADIADAINFKTDAELAPILEAERARVLAGPVVNLPHPMCDAGYPIALEPCEHCGVTYGQDCGGTRK